MRLINNGGSFYTVVCSRADVDAFKRSYPCSGLTCTWIAFEYDKRNGDLVDMTTGGKQEDTPALVALSADAQAYGVRMLEPETLVIFRKYHDGEILALFPELPADRKHCTCYAHVGQHSAADYQGCIRSSRPATPDEYKALARELESAPYTYRLKIRTRYARRAVRHAS